MEEELILKKKAIKKLLKGGEVRVPWFDYIIVIKGEKRKILGD